MTPGSFALLHAKPSSRARSPTALGVRRSISRTLSMSATPYDARMNVIHRLAPALLILALTGCSTFDRDYKQALASGVPANSIEGPWEGRWTSQGGHGGDRLRAIVTRTAPDTYHARF